MKIFYLIIGICLILLSLFQGGRYVGDYGSLTAYGQGYVWGSVLLFIAGTAFVYLGLRKKHEPKQ